MKKDLIYFLIITLFSFFVFLAVFLFKESFPKPLSPVKIERQETYTLLFAGDVMLDRGVKHMVEDYGKGDYRFPFLKIKETLDSSDVLFGNLESVISDKGYDVGGIYSFRADPQAMDALLYAGFDVVSLANNHAFDYTRSALEDTMNRLKENRIGYTGAGFNKEEAHSPFVITLGEDTTLGFLGYTDFLFPSAVATEERAGVTAYSSEIIKRDIEKAKENVDILVVTFHYGEEYQQTQNRKQEQISKQAIDYGADIIIGHHPHVTQPVEEYNGKHIAYSLGNFLFDQYFSKETMEGFLLEVRVRNKKIVGVEKIHYRLNQQYQPFVIEK